MTEDLEKQEEEGLTEVLLERFEKIRLPRLLDIKEKVDQGERLNDFDIRFLEEAMRDAQGLKHYVDARPAFQNLYARAAALYGEITRRALANEESAQGSAVAGGERSDPKT